MRKISMFLLAIAVIAGMSVASAQDKAAPKQNASFQKADTNGDGVLSTEEYKAAMKRMEKRREQSRAKANKEAAEGKEHHAWDPPREGRGEGMRRGEGRGGRGEGMRRGEGPGGRGEGMRRGEGPSGPGGPHMMLQRADTNKDGNVTKKEFAQAAPNAPKDAFERMDRNGDGVLNKEDRPKDGRGPGGPDGPHMMFQRADANGDGQVTKKEFTKAAPQAPADAFERMDRNGDGVLNQEDRPEEGRGQQARQGQRRGPQDGTGRRGSGQGKERGEHRERMKAMDTNQDGNISAQEFKAGHPDAPADAFERMDSNDDGVLNQEDFQGRGRGQGPRDGSGRRGGQRPPPPPDAE